MVVQSSLKSYQYILNNWQVFFVLFLLGIICLSGVLIVQVQHKVRHLETEYSISLLNRVILHEEKGKLLLEKHHLTALSRVEMIAKDRLKMVRVSKQSSRVQTIYLHGFSGVVDVE